MPVTPPCRRGSVPRAIARNMPPLGVVLLLAELAGTSAALLRLSGLLLLAGRIGQAWALSGRGRFAVRTAGMLMTFAALVLSAVLALPRSALFRRRTTFPLRSRAGLYRSPAPKDAGVAQG